MAITGSWGWNNTTPATHAVTPTLIDTVHDYAVVDKIGNTPVPVGTFALSNLSTPNDGNEYITYKVRDIPEVKLAAGVQHPARVKAAREVNVRLEAVKRLKSDNDDSFIVDLPGEMDVTIRLPLNENITAADADLLYSRLTGALFAPDDSGESRFAKLLKGKVDPNG